MPHMITKERLSETIAFRVTPTIYRFLENLAKGERRKMSEINTALLERGIAAFQRDGQIFEPRPRDVKTNSRRRNTGTDGP